MVAIVLLHMVQVLLFGAYKYPRELTWLAGVFLLLMTLGMAFTGQILRWDQDAYWGLGIGASIAGRVPLVGLQLVQILLGGPIIAGETLTRFFALHVFVIPGVLIGLVGVHLLMVINLGVNEWPMPGRIVKRETYLKEYQELVHKDGLPFVPVAFQKDVVFAGLITLAVIAMCRLVRAFRADRRARSDDYRVGAEAGLFLPLDLLGAGADASRPGDVRAARRTCHRHPRRCWPCPSSPVKARRAGAAGRLPCSRS